MTRDIREQQTGVTLNSREHVVEVVRYAAGQSTDCLHFLSLTELLFQLALFADIDQNFHDGEYAAIRIRDGRSREEHAHARSILPQPNDFLIGDMSATQYLLDFAPEIGLSFG